MARDESFDVVVIGSGAGGGPVALTLAEAGARVLVLEKGPYHSLRQFTHDEIGICRRNFFVPYLEDDPHTLRKDGAPHAERTTEGWISQCVGGGTVHMSGFWYRLHDEDFRLATLTGGIEGADLADWPISLTDLEPFYDLAEVQVGVSGKAGLNPFEKRRRPYPLPPLRAHPVATLVETAATKRGWHPYPTARAILSETYGLRPPCTYCGLCGEYGCENTSKSSVLHTLIPRAEATGRCEVRAECMVQKIIERHGAATAVEYQDAHGHLQLVRGRVVVLAASAIESARLLLLSANARFPEGLANQDGLVGRNLTFSTFGKGTAILARQKLIAKLGASGMDLPFLHRSVQDDYWVPRAGLPSPKGGTYNFLFHHPNPINAVARLAIDADWSLWGEALKERMLRYFRDELWVEFEVFGEFLPWKGTWIDLDPEVKDRWGLPVARMNVTHHPANREVSSWMVKRGLDLLESIDPAPESVKPWTWGSTTFHLHQGTCRFGNHASTSVLDPSCQAHGVRNLYVTDGSFMPTSGGVPATPTILANSFRVAQILRERFRRREVD